MRHLYNVLLDTMDIISGWCSLFSTLYDTEILRNAA